MIMVSKAPFINTALGVITFFSYMASLFMIVSAALGFGFHLTYKQVDELKLLYFWVWITFLIDRGSHLLLMRRGYVKSEYSFLGWCVNSMLVLTLIPIVVEIAGIDDSYGLMSILDNHVFHVTVLFLISLINLSDELSDISKGSWHVDGGESCHADGTCRSKQRVDP